MKEMKRICAFVLAAALLAAGLTGCGAAGQTDSEAPAPSAGSASGDGQLTGTVVTNGSTSMEKAVKALIEGFKAVQPGITVTYEPTGSGSGIEAARNGSADIGLSSRSLSGEELAALTETVVARDGIAIVVNPANGVDELTVEQVAAIARGEVTDWSQVGGSGGAIAFIGREAGSGTRGAFEELTGTQDACAYAQELTSTGAVITAVSTTPGAIGYASLSGVSDSVKAVKIGGVECTEETVRDGSYPIQRPFVFATLTDGALSQAAQAFFEFALSAQAAELYEAAGVVPANG